MGGTLEQSGHDGGSGGGQVVVTWPDGGCESFGSPAVDESTSRAADPALRRPEGARPSRMGMRSGCGQIAPSRAFSCAERAREGTDFLLLCAWMSLPLLAGVPANDELAADEAVEQLLVVNHGDGSIVVLQPDTGARAGVVRVGAGPCEIAISSDGRTAIVPNYGGSYGGQTLSDNASEPPG